MKSKIGPQARILPFQELKSAKAYAEVATKFDVMAEQIQKKSYKPKLEYPQYDYARPFSPTKNLKTTRS